MTGPKAPCTLQGEKIHEGGLARTRGPHDRQCLPAVHGDGNILDDALLTAKAAPPLNRHCELRMLDVQDCAATRFRVCLRCCLLYRPRHLRAKNVDEAA
eukprot:CAMPEP_0115745400 /NCGR_PEP_ID=MMETSP0272-20121206/92102_1 /TAXON_ID=71861 /ORGANISM="Scrippsiella trochoidea, Strain CCMP3099" /LENGTH=98 /DNA_ID=CAMNT_0003190309 /DNA_START=212 /DNA_END=508 /DNA_ORIENTATION=+